MLQQITTIEDSFLMAHGPLNIEIELDSYPTDDGEVFYDWLAWHTPDGIGREAIATGDACTTRRDAISDAYRALTAHYGSHWMITAIWLMDQ